MTRFLGIDLGTSFVKVAALDLDRLRLEHIRRVPFPAPLDGLPPLHYEVDPEAVVAAVRAALDALLPQIPDCAGIVMSTQMHSVVLVDGAGRALTNAVTWLDQRVRAPHPDGGTFFEALAGRLGETARRELGNELRPGLPIGTLFWLAQRGELPPGATPLTMADYVLTRIAGAPPGIELTNAAASGALDVGAGEWHRAALAALGLDALDWPAIRPLDEPAGAYAAHGRPIPCYRPVGDAQCALLGAGLEPGELSINIATGSQVSLLRDEPATGDYQLRPFFDGRFLATLSGLPAGRALNLLVGLLTELAAAHGAPIDNPWPYLLRAAEAAPDSDLRVNLAFFDGAEGWPGAIERIDESNLTAGGLFRAAFRQMAENYHAAALRLSPERAWERLVLTGGLARQAAPLRDLIAGRFGVSYRLGPEEDALAGLLALALVCSGRAASAMEASRLVRAATTSASL
ncbi:MAG: FGGY family carbohydrate kinase [Chloroflexota bacterium]